MQLLRQYAWICIVAVMLIFGCSMKFTQEEAARRVSEAREHFEVVKSLEIKDVYSQEYAAAESSLIKAEEMLNKSSRDKAVETAGQSLEVSRRILRKFYVETIGELARKARKELEKKTEGDSDNPLTGYVPKLDTVVEQVEKVEKDEQLLSLNTILDDLKEILQITYSIQTSSAKTLESDISFDKGKYELSDKGKEGLKSFLEKIVADKETYLAKHPDKKVATKVKTVGYTDEVNFTEGTERIKSLMSGVEDQVPQIQPARRQFLNQRLSEFRARSVAGYIESFISKGKDENPRFRVDAEIVGHGEKIPANVPAPYPVQDPRRRICKVYTYTTVH
ncbi:MAG: hypothetical protein BWK80_44785 [Desulfobacteraceae bacterium IS3]|nr:MAG: hypothetical protein BWK80_44785 [Desulfobacteraceae bacterium IS3]